jgi:beta-glucanase (GH16 family)
MTTVTHPARMTTQQSRGEKTLNCLNAWLHRAGYSITAIITISLLLWSAGAGAQSWELSWSDEFDGPADSPPDASKWGYDVGGGGWGNNELQYYTSRTQNAFLDGNGNLVIKAVNETYTGADGVTRNYTSARILTKGRFQQRYGRFEARIKLPFGQGLWPAFWMLGNDIDTVGWPASGEIDIMENRGREPSIVSSALHGPGYSGATPIFSRYTLADDQRFADDFHVFAVEWEPEAIRFYVDGNLYHSVAPTNLPQGARWVFDHPFFIILNVAVGGNFGGNPDSTTIWPQMMAVDYVRVYRDPARRPFIANVSIKKKNLIVMGGNFDDGAVILMDGERQKTLRDDIPSTLIGKKVAKKIAPGQTVTLQVRNSDGELTDEFAFTRQ